MNALAGRIRLDFRADEPIYAQIVRQVEALVRAGTLKPGDQLPTVRELAIDLRINFSTVARAYRILDEQRLISTQRGRGTYIEDAASNLPAAMNLPMAANDLPAEDSPPGQVAEGAGAYQAQPANGQLAALARRYLSEAAGLGATAEQIEQVFRQQLEDWKREHPAHPGHTSGG